MLRISFLFLQTSPVGEEESSSYEQRSSKHLRSNSSDEELTQAVNDLETEEINNPDLTLEAIDSAVEETSAALQQQRSRQLPSFSGKLMELEIPKRGELFERVESENLTVGPSGNNVSVDSRVEGGYESADEGFGAEMPNQNRFDEEDEMDEVENIPKEAILERINSKKGTESFQLGKQLSCKWTTGAGPRIGCVRDYPSELQFRALEQVNLSPRSIGHSRSTGGLGRRVKLTGFSEGAAGTTGSPVLAKGDMLQRSLPLSKTQSTPLPGVWLE